MVIDDVQPVMVTDASVNSHPIVVDVNHPDQINEVFDAISYSKVKYKTNPLKHNKLTCVKSHTSLE